MRPVLAGMGTLKEVKKEWSIDELEEAHEALDIKAEAEVWASEMAKAKAES